MIKFIPRWQKLGDLQLLRLHVPALNAGVPLNG